MADRTNFQEIARTVAVSYPIPWLIASWLAFTLALFGLALSAHGPLQWFFAVLGLVAFGASMALTFYGLLFKPERLRSERFTLMRRALEVIGNDEMTPEQRQSVAGGFKMLLGSAEHDNQGPVSNQGRGGTQDAVGRRDTDDV